MADANMAAPPPSAADEVAGLDKVLMRLAVTDDDKLEKVAAAHSVRLMASRRTHAPRHRRCNARPPRPHHACPMAAGVRGHGQGSMLCMHGCMHA